jgi:hypothetical protein
LTVDDVGDVAYHRGVKDRVNVLVVVVAAFVPDDGDGYGWLPDKQKSWSLGEPAFRNYWRSWDSRCGGELGMAIAERVV